MNVYKLILNFSKAVLETWCINIWFKTGLINRDLYFAPVCKGYLVLGIKKADCRFYSCSSRSVNLNGFEFEQGEKPSTDGLVITINESNVLEGKKDLNSFILKIEGLLKMLKSINKKGFLNNKVNIPIVVELIKSFNLSKTFEEYNKSLREASTEYERLKLKATEPYVGFEINKWCYNLLILNLYILSLKVLKSFEGVEPDSEESDRLADLEMLVRNLEGLLDPTIGKRLQKSGLCITQNIYQGFDTEYELLDPYRNLNELLSIQLAAQSRILLKVPLFKDFVLEYLHPITSESEDIIYKQNKHLKDDLKSIVLSIDYNIKVCRSIKYPEYAEFLNILIEGLRNSNKVKFFESGDKIVFLLPHTEVEQLFKFVKVYSLKELINDTDTMMDKSIKDNNEMLSKIINDLLGKDLINIEKMNKAFNKSCSRFSATLKTERIYITTRLNLILGCHFSSADLSMLNDFEEFKDDLTIVSKCYVIFGRGCSKDEWRFSLHIRDTMLLAPASSKSLADIGKMYGDDFKKIDLKKYRGKMKLLALEKPDLFKEYAMRDALITLKHMIMMEEFNEGLNKTGVPLTLSSLSKAYVLKEWVSQEYNGYQMLNGYSFGKIKELVTPKGLSTTGLIGYALNYYISSYRGGRNESFMYGVDKGRKWIDYDLSGAYPTAMAFLGNPDYRRIRKIDEAWLKGAHFSDLINSFTVLHVSFEYPESVKYPSLPCQVDKDISIYPLKGETTITGLDYVLAVEQGCRIKLKNGYNIPFSDWTSIDKKDNEKRKKDLAVYKDEKSFNKGFEETLSKTGKPFNKVVKELVNKRKEYPKGTFNNLMYKTIANSIYGLTAQGLSGKSKFDIKSGGSKTLEGGELTNPLVAGYVTSFVRAVIGECLHNINESKGSVVSVTTDGFITDIDNLECFLLSKKFKKSLFLRMFLALRRYITDKPDETCIEVKNVEGFEGDSENEEAEVGLISWTTRGQLGFSSGIKACTGFQSKGLSKERLTNALITVMKSGDLSDHEYIQNSLRSAKDIYLKGGHATKVYRDQSFKMVFDNKRQIVKNVKKTFEVSTVSEASAVLLNNENSDASTVLFDSKPWENVEECKEVRSLIQLLYTKDYNRLLTKSSSKRYKTDLETAVRTFIKGLFINEGLFGVKNTDIGNYNEIVKFINEFKGIDKIKISKDSISKLKNRPMVLYSVPVNSINEEFASYVKSKYSKFDCGKFFSEWTNEGTNEGTNDG